MALNECIPFYEDGDHISGYCTAPVPGKRFVKISGNRSGGTINLVATTAGDGGAPHIALADIGGRIHGVSAYDGAASATIDVVRGAKMVVPVLAGADAAAFTEVAVGPAGTAIPAGSEASVAATLTTGVVNDNNAIKWTAQHGGSIGNGITVEIKAATSGKPAGTVDVDDQAITVYVTLTTTTAAQVQTAVTADEEASALVAVANASTSNGTAAVTAVSPTALSGGAEGGRADQAVGYLLTAMVAGADAQVSLY